MKKRIIAVILCLILALGALSACGESNTILGSWEGKIDMTEQFNQFFAELGSKETIDNCEMTMKLDITENRIVFSMDKDSVTAAMKKLVDVMKPVYKAMIEGFIGSSDEYSNVEDYAKSQGYESFDAMIEEALGEEELKENMLELGVSGDYKAEGDKLIINGDESMTITYKLENGVLTFVESDSEDFSQILPIEFKR